MDGQLPLASTYPLLHCDPCIQKWFHTFSHFWSNLTSITNFSANLENLFKLFFHHVQKLWFWPFFGTFGQNRPKWEFLLKIEPCYFLPSFSHNFIPSFRKIVWAVSEINSLHTSIHTYIQRWSHRTGRFRWFN